MPVRRLLRPVWGLAAVVALTGGAHATDTANPTVTVTAPAVNTNYSSLSSVAGTAADDTGLKRIDVFLYRSYTGVKQYFNFSTRAWSTTAPATLSVTPDPNTTGNPTTLSWSVTGATWPTSTEMPTGEYNMEVRSVDTSNKVSAWSRPLFSVGTPDSTAPTAVYTSPTADVTDDHFPTTWAGTGNDSSGSGIGYVQFSIYRKFSATTEYWSGSATTGWTTTKTLKILTPSAPDGNGDQTWSYSLNAGDWTAPTGTNLPQGQYTAAYNVYDRYGNLRTLNRLVYILPVDSTKPVSVITSPAIPVDKTDVVTVSPTSIVGYSYDPLDENGAASGVASAYVGIFRTWNGNTLYWDGSGWVAAVKTYAVTLGAPDVNGHCTWNFPPANLTMPVLTQGAYTIRVNTNDRYDNASTLQQSLYIGPSDTTAPTAAVTAPAINSSVSALTSVTGTATDTDSGVSRLEVTLSRTNAGVTEFWSGSAWNTAVTKFLPNIGTPAPGGIVTWDLSTGFSGGAAFPSGANLPEGAYNIGITVGDRYLNLATVNSTFMVHALPSISAAADLTATAQNARVVLSWTAGAGATYYQVRRATQTGGPYTTIEEVNSGTTYTDSNVSNGQDYFYVVTSSLRDGYGIVHTAADSNEADATPEPQPLPPLSLVATPANQRVMLTWQGSARASNYEIWRSGGPNAWAKLTTVAAVSGTTMAYSDTGLVNGTVYSYFVRALNGSTQNVDSNEVSVRPDTLVSAAPPAPVVTSQTHSSVTFAAPALPAYADSLSLVANGSDYTYKTGITAGETFTVTGLQAGDYDFCYLAVGPGGQTPGSPTSIWLAGLPDAPGQPYFTNVTSTSYIVVSPEWPGWEQALDYNWTDHLGLQIQGAGGTWTDVTAPLENYDAYLTLPVTGAAPDTAYTYRFVAYNSQGETTNGAAATVHTGPGTPPTPLFTSVSATGLTVRDVATGGTPPSLPAGAASLTLQRYTPDGWMDMTSGLTGAAQVTASGLIPATSYTFRYVAVGTYGRTEGASASESTSTGTFTAPGAPTFSDIHSTSLTVWADLPGTGGYSDWTLQVRPESSGTYADSASTGGADSVVATGLTAGTKYYFRWKDENGNPGAEAPVTLGPITPVAPIVAAGTGYSLIVTVPGAATGVNSYTLYYGFDDTSVNLAVASGIAPGASVTLSNLTPGDRYNFWVLAVGPDASTPGPSAAGTVASHPFSKPDIPRVANITPTTIDVLGAAYVNPDLGQLTLQYKTTAGTPWADVSIGTSDVLISGLTSSTSYDLRMRAAAPGATDFTNAVYSDVVTVSTLPPAPGTPPAPNILATDTDSVTVEVPTLPAYTTSLGLQMRPGSSGSFATVVATATGTSINVENLVPLSTYEFRWAANGSGGVTYGPSSTTTLQTGVPPEPGAPTFGDLTDSTVQVVSPAIPPCSFPLSLSLQMKQGGQPDTAYSTLATNVPAEAVTLVDSLVPGSTYDFRYVLASTSASTPGEAAAITTAIPVVSWNASQGIGCAGIRYPVSGASFTTGQTVRLSSGLATDWDQMARSINGHSLLKDVSDPCSYLWTCTGGTFSSGGAGDVNNVSSPPQATGPTVLWHAPATAGTYTLSLTVMDQSQGSNIVNGQFHNNRSDSETGTRSDPVRGYPDEPLHFSVTVTVTP